MGEFAGRRVLVTGAGSGIGRGIAAAFVREGAHVAVVDIDPERVAKTVDRLAGGPGRAAGVPGDVRDAERVVEEAARAVGPIEVLVNDAAVYPNCPVIEMPDDQWDEVIGVNLTGTFRMSRAVARRMVAAKIQGHIVNIASGAYKSARRGASHYCASKAGIVMLTKVLAQELAEHRIHVNVVSPGLVDVGRRGDVNPGYRQTLMTNIPWGRMGVPDDIAAAVLFMSSRTADYVTGTVIDVDGGSSAGRFFLPYSRG
ncbi:MAG TPA: SDR family NAD(P)-dependent oxidoreductase [bacterium]|nr:SDR family NAD(P)-dependent oxidoreductase [bacterium]